MLSYPKDKITILLLEGIDPAAAEIFCDNGYSNVKILPHALEGRELEEILEDVFIVGIRSRTRLTDSIIQKAPRLFAIGCFCIGTDQVALREAALKGIPVFNAPHSNTRSVAELVIGLSIMLMRNIFPKSVAAHQGIWEKTAKGSFEARGKVIGIVGYGHIGTQVSVLAEAMGMHVVYYDIESKLPLGNAHPLDTLDHVLKASDIVTLHVPDTPQTRDMIGRAQIRKMKKGACLINYSRGKVVDIEALRDAIDSRHLLGAAVDVFPQEPDSLGPGFVSPLQGLQQVILTPHIGGSTEEAQRNIAKEVSRKLVYYSDRGSTEGAVNFPTLTLAPVKDTHRLLHIHHNVPGMLQQINKVIADEKINISGQFLLTNADIGYVVLDIEKKATHALIERLRDIKHTVRARVLY